MSETRRHILRSNLLAAALSVLLAVAAAIVVIALTRQHSRAHAPRRAQVHHQAHTPATLHLFATDSVWNKPLGADAPLAPDSSQLVAQLLDQYTADGAWINTYSYSVPVYTVGRDQPKVKVALDARGPSATGLAAAFAAGVPIPPGATAAPGTDRHMVVVQPSTDTMWEFWEMHKVDGVWNAQWGGRMEHFSSNPGYFDDPPTWGATATSIPLLAGLMQLGELRAGHIDHALAIAIPQAGTGHVLPAERSDGTDSAPDAIPEGTRFRIPADVDLDALHLPPMTLMIARAVQRYGMIVRDHSATISFYGQEVTGSDSNPYYSKHGLLASASPSALLRSFPWHDLQVVAPPTGG